MFTANKGEWSEIYAFYKILGDGKLYPGNADLEKIENFFYPVVSVIREEYLNKKVFSIDNANIIISDNVNSDVTIPIQRFITEAKKLLLKIKNSSGTFTAKRAEDFLNELG